MIWYRYCCSEIVGLARDSPRFPDPGPYLQPFLAVDTENLMKSVSTRYSTGSSWADPWADLPNGRKIRGWLHQFPGKLAVHPGVGVTQLTIYSKFLRNPPSSCAARHPPAFEQLEYCRPWNIVIRPIDPRYSSDSWGSQQSKERIITNADLVQPGKSYLAVPTAKFNWWTSENSYVIASIKAPLKSAAWRSKFVIFHTCATFFKNFLVAL
jgi:hypothetical protein